MVLAATLEDAVNGMVRYGEGISDQILEIDRNPVDNFWWRSTQDKIRDTIAVVVQGKIWSAEYWWFEQTSLLVHSGVRSARSAKYMGVHVLGVLSNLQSRFLHTHSPCSESSRGTTGRNSERVLGVVGL